MRLFIAIDLPESIKTYLRELQNVLPSADLSKTHDFHLTLKFLGECDERKIAKVSAALATLPSFDPFEMTLGSLGTFGRSGPFGGRFPRVVFLSVIAPPFLTQLACLIEQKMQRLGFPLEHRFRPHLTLARVKYVAEPEAFSKALHEISVAPKIIPVSQFFLFQSELLPSGVLHTKLRF